MNWNSTPIVKAAANIIKKYGSCARENCATEYLAISLAPDSAVVIIPTGLIKAVAIQPTTTPAAIASAMNNISVNWNVSMIVVDTVNAATAKMQNFSMLNPSMPSKRPAPIGNNCCHVGSFVMCGAARDIK